MPDAPMRFSATRLPWLANLCWAAAVLGLISFAGCQPSQTPVETTGGTVSNEASEHDHDHEGHDHGDHEGHNHGDVIDAAALGLSADDLVPSDRPEAPKSLDAAVQQLVDLRDDVAIGFAADQVDSIHDQLHSVGDLLETIETMVKASSLDANAKTEAAGAVKTLFDDFGAVDAKLHGEPGKDYHEVSQSIDNAVQVLTKLTK